MDEPTWEKCEKLWKNQLSKALELYLDMSKEYHTIPSIQNKNANKLLIESVTNIHEVLDQQLKSIYEYKLRELSVIHRQTEEIKKSHKPI